VADGYSIQVSGFQYAYGSLCDCVSDYDGTYFASRTSPAGSCYGEGEWEVCYTSGTYSIMMKMEWTITPGDGEDEDRFDLDLTVARIEDGTLERTELGGARFYGLFDLATIYDPIENSQLTFDGYILDYNGDEPTFCSGIDQLEVYIDGQCMASAQMSGSCTIVLTSSATIKGYGELTGESSLAVSLGSATVVGVGSLVGEDCYIELNSEATARGKGRLTGSSSLSLSSSGGMRAVGWLVGEDVYIEFSATDDATLAGKGRMSGSSSLTFSSSGGMRADGQLVGEDIYIELLPYDATLVGKGRLYGSSSLELTVTGDTWAGGGLRGNLTITLTSSGFGWRRYGTNGTVSAQLSASGTLTGDGALSGSSSLTLTADAAGRAKRMAVGETYLELTTNEPTLAGTGNMTGSSTIRLTALCGIFSMGSLSGSSSLAFTSSSTAMRGTGAMTGSSSLAVTASVTLTGGSGGRGFMSSSSGSPVTITLNTTGWLYPEGGVGSRYITGSSTVTLTDSGTLTGTGSMTGSATLTFTTDAEPDQKQCWPCYCERDCLIGEDDFERASIGGDWAVQSGTWSIIEEYGGYLTTQDANAYIRYETEHPDAVAEHVVLTILSKESDYVTPGDKARIVLCDTLYAELELGLHSSSVTSYGCMTLRLYNDTTLLAEAAQIRVESTDGIALWAGYSETTGVFWAVAATSDGRFPSRVQLSENVGTVSGTKVGLGTGDAVNGTVAFTHFYYYRHNYSTVTTECYEPGPDTVPTCTFVNPWYCQTGTDIADVGCGWVKVSGSWDAVAGSPIPSLETEDSGALVMSEVPQDDSNCIEPTPLGYHYAVFHVRFDTAGDEAKLLIDANSDGSTSHYAIVTCGANTTGDGGSIKLYSTGGLLEELELPSRWYSYTDAILPNATYYVEVCMHERDGIDIFSCRIGTIWLSTATTVNGEGHVGFGTGSTVGGTVKFLSAIGLSNTGTCEACTPTECDGCAGDIGPNGGLSVSVSGLQTTYGFLCDCTDVDGTYVIPFGSGSPTYFGHTGSCGGWVSQEFCEVRPLYYGFDVKVGWAIEELESGGWKLTVDVEVSTYGNLFYGLARGSYEAEFDSSVRCDEISGAELTFVEKYQISPFPIDPSWYMCVNWENLIVTATSY
jgi:hypothetical protein